MVIAESVETERYTFSNSTRTSQARLVLSAGFTTMYSVAPGAEDGRLQRRL